MIYQRHDTAIFKERQKEILNYDDLQACDLSTYLTAIEYRPVNAQLTTTFGELLRDRAKSGDITNIFAGLPPNLDISTYVDDLKNQLDSLIIKKKNVLFLEFCRKVLKDCYAKFNALDGRDPQKTVWVVFKNKLQQDPYNFPEELFADNQAAAVKIIFSYFYEIIIKNISQSLSDEDCHLLLRAAKSLNKDFENNLLQQEIKLSQLIPKETKKLADNPTNLLLKKLQSSTSPADTKCTLLRYASNTHQTILKYQAANHENEHIALYQQQHKKTQELLFFNEEFSSENLITKLTNVLNLDIQKQKFTNLESVFKATSKNIGSRMQQLTDDLNQIIQEIPNQQLNNKLTTAVNALKPNEHIATDLRNLWKEAKTEKPSFLGACVKSLFRWFNGHKDVKGLAERDCLEQIRIKIKHFLINVEFEGRILMTIDEFQKGNISQTDVETLLKKKIPHDYNERLLVRLERLEDFSVGFSNLVKQHNTLLSNADARTTQILSSNSQENILEQNQSTHQIPKNISLLMQSYGYKSAYFKFKDNADFIDEDSDMGYEDLITSTLQYQHNKF